MPPPTQRQRPQRPLHERQQHLIPSRDPRDPIPRIHPVQTRQVALLEAEVGERREVRATGDWLDGGGGDVVFGAGNGGCGRDGPLGGCGGGRVEVVGGVGVVLYGGGLDGRCNFYCWVRHCWWFCAYLTLSRTEVCTKSPATAGFVLDARFSRFCSQK